MSIRGVIFTADEVRATLDGRKSQFRRVMRPQPREHHWSCLPDYKHVVRLMLCSDGLNAQSLHLHGAHLDNDVQWIRSPFGQVGDQLFVKETWAHHQPVLDRVRSDGGSFSEIGDGSAAYRADGFSSIDDCRSHLMAMHNTHSRDCREIIINGNAWRSSVHMPQWASRLTLEVTGIRVQKVTDITEEDAKAEGVSAFFERFKSIGRDQRLTTGEVAADAEHRASFAVTWDSRNPKHPWASSPWIWCVSYKVVRP
jgi:hypothetical protein